MNLHFIKQHGFALPAKFYALLNNEFAQVLPPTLFNAITFTFSDSNYSPETGGYHPVEIRLEKCVSTNQANCRLISESCQWQCIYITDFSYQGGADAELVKEIDIDFVAKQIYCLYGGWLSPRQGSELLTLFISNFMEYHHMNVFTVTVNFD